MKNIKYSLIIKSVLILVLFSCTPKIVKYEYDTNFRGYKIFVKGGIGKSFNYIARFKDGKKIQIDEEIKKFVKENKEKPIHIKPSVKWDLTEKEKFKLSKLYYSGLRDYKNKNFETAIIEFNKAIELNKKIIRYTDIYYLIAKSYYYLGDNEKAQEYFKKFIEYSESITHLNFHYYYHDSDGDSIDELFNDAENHLKDNPKDNEHDLGFKYHKEDYYAKYKNRYCKPGFIKGRYLNKNLITLGLYYSSSFGWGAYAGIYAGLLKSADFDIYYLYAEKSRQFYLGFPFSIYSDKHKRFGIKFIPAFYYTSRYLKEEEPEKKFWKSFPNFSGDISIGYYINHYWLIFTGYKHYYYNKENPYEFTTKRYWWKLWDNNNYYIGNTVYLFKDIGITLEYRYENVLTYLEIASIKIGYNISEDKAFLSFLNFNSDY